MATRVWTAATLNPPLLTRSSSSSPIQPVSSRRSVPRGRLRLRSSARPRSAKFVCRRAKNADYDDYKFPDPIPEFAEQETSKFKEHMTWRLEQEQEEYFGEHVEEIVDIWAHLRDFLGT